MLLDDDGGLVLWHTRGVCMHKCVFHQDSGDLSKRLLRSAVSAVSFSRNGIHTKVFLEGRVRGDLDLVFSTTLQVQSGANHIVGHCVGVDSARYFLGVRVRWGVDDL